MQQLRERRLTNTPADIPQVRSNCGLSLNSPERVRDSVADLKTSLNNPDAALTYLRREKGGLMLAYIINKHGRPLMPCHPVKARLLLKQGKARIVKRTPFTIQLLFGSSGYKQSVTLGVDSGYTGIGLSAVTPKQEIYSAEVQLRADIVKLNSERRQYRRARRYRKTWYRKPRFLNRKKPEYWLAPSIQNKLDTHVKVINQVKAILLISYINIEVAAFDIQKIKNPEISSVDYQNGVQKDFWNVREYVLYRDNHICQHCNGKSKDRVLEVHHIVSRQVGGDRPDNLITLCRSCHKKVSAGELILKVQPSRGFKAETFMSMVRWMLVNKLRGLDNSVSHTYGYITKSKRIQLGLPKSYINDAFVIAGGDKQKRLPVRYHIRQVRKCNRRLFKGDRSHIRNTADRIVKGFQRFDKVLWKGIECFIFGRRTTGYFDLRKADGTKIHPSVSYKQTSLIERARTLLIERRQAAHPHA
jgi:N6-L-threonylcarbamoyladenine synthase